MTGEFGNAANGASFDLRTFIETYLSAWHRGHPWQGCPIAALMSELSHRPASARAAVVEQGRATIETIASGLPAYVDAPERFMRALEVMSHLIGTLQRARFVTDRTVSDEILERGRAAALRLADIETPT